MLLLANVVQAWGAPHFMATLKREIESINIEYLPLQQGLTSSNYVLDNGISTILKKVTETNTHICITAGIFYQGVISGCSCADDPSPINENHEYCEVQIRIDKSTAVTAITLLD